MEPLIQEDQPRLFIIGSHFTASRFDNSGRDRLGKLQLVVAFLIILYL